MSENNSQKTRPFTKADNAVLYSRYLTFGEKFLYFYVKSKPRNWKFNLKKIAQQTHESVGAITSSFDGLKSLGLIARKPVNNTQFNYIIYEYDDKSIEQRYENIKRTKIKNPRKKRVEIEIPKPEKIEPEKSKVQKTTDHNNTENPTNTECESIDTHTGDSINFELLAREIELSLDPKPINSKDDIFIWSDFLKRNNFSDPQIIQQVTNKLNGTRVTTTIFTKVYKQIVSPPRKKSKKEKTKATPEEIQQMIAESRAALSNEVGKK
ncbi:hypothetical protein PQO01_07130 [Lentisphaera marina]|uniref:hypothetical protein n=1 Tax=Lentisphaera marina TaxID=1111041 RepID=UPI0023673908|nr:hypothetical protein [Lentisphaera marina]MDD7984720.1 hypothetical protein [Lentisphaera marina]